MNKLTIYIVGLCGIALLHFDLEPANTTTLGFTLLYTSIIAALFHTNANN